MRVTDHLGNTFKSKQVMAEYYGKSINVLNSRLKNGWDLEKALTTPVRKMEKINIPFTNQNEYNRTYQQLKKEQIRLRKRRYYEANKEHLKAYQANYQKNKKKAMQECPA